MSEVRATGHRRTIGSADHEQADSLTSGVVLSGQVGKLWARLDELDAQPSNLRLRYEDLALDLDATAERIGGYLGVELVPSIVDRPAQDVTTPSATASVSRWRSDLTEDDAIILTPIAERLGY